MIAATEPEWTRTGRIGFRFLICYLILFFFPFPSGLVKPYWLGGVFDPLWQKLVPLVFDKFVTIPNENNGGSGDTTFDYLRILCMLMVAAVVTVIWSIIDRRRTDYRTLHAWMRLWLRYVLALCMLTYGAVKVLMVQFEPPGYGRLAQPLGEFSPMALLWIFMGFSPLYTCFTGLMEVFGGLLLLFRRTTTLGALIIAGVMTNVVMLNMSYDVCVKLGSIHILFLALVLAAPDLKRVLDFFVLNRPTQPVDRGPHLGSGLRPFVLALKTLAIGALLTYFGWDTYQSYKQQAAARLDNPRAPDGWYRIVAVTNDGARPPALRLDDFRWRMFTLREGKVNLSALDGTSYRFRVEGDPTLGPAELFPLDDANEPVAGAASAGWLTLKVSDQGEASLRGVLGGRGFEAEMRRRNPSDFPLTSRGFRWISEAPYFR